jgi:hypothetical protein
MGTSAAAKIFLTASEISGPMPSPARALVACRRRSDRPSTPYGEAPRRSYSRVNSTRSNVRLSQLVKLNVMQSAPVPLPTCCKLCSSAGLRGTVPPRQRLVNQHQRFKAFLNIRALVCESTFVVRWHTREERCSNMRSCRVRSLRHIVAQLACETTEAA